MPDTPTGPVFRKLQNGGALVRYDWVVSITELARKLRNAHGVNCTIDWDDDSVIITADQSGIQSVQELLENQSGGIQFERDENGSVVISSEDGRRVINGT